jgi:pyrimidine-nucleoside phosphorylase
MIPQWIIAKKRDGGTLTEAEINFFIEGLCSDDIPRYQISALLMAIYFRGMNLEETTHLAKALIASGETLDFSHIDLPIVDKHSTGGIGDKISLVLAPLVASCDIAVPMISGRGLGITGGTLDKLESITGYNSQLSKDQFMQNIQECGCAIINQTSALVPADKILYALRDVTGTVPSIPLIATSIMSKKIASGVDALVLDVKFGHGAFMEDIEQARELAKTMIAIGQSMGKKVVALITDMNTPLGCAVGNSLEIHETIQALKGQGPADLMEVTFALAEQMLLMGGIAKDATEARQLLQAKIDSGEAFEKFKQMLALQGADLSVIDAPEKLPHAKIQHAVIAHRAGFIAGVDAKKIGKAVLWLGGGRKKVEDVVDHAVGLSGLKQKGDEVKEGDCLALVHGQDQATLDKACELLEGAFTIVDEPVQVGSKVVEVLT